MGCAGWARNNAQECEVDTYAEVLQLLRHGLIWLNARILRARAIAAGLAELQ